MSKDEILQKLYEIVRWDYAEGADEKYPCPFPANVGKHVKKLLREAEAHLTQRALDGGDSPAQQALFTPEADTAEGKLPAPVRTSGGHNRTVQPKT